MLSFISGLIGGIIAFTLLNLIFRRKGRRNCEENRQCAIEVEKHQGNKEKKLSKLPEVKESEAEYVKEKVNTIEQELKVESKPVEKNVKSKTETKSIDIQQDKKVKDRQTQSTSSKIKLEDEGEWVVAKKGKNKAK